MVFKRKHIGIIYSPTSTWVAGAYYIQNIVASLAHCNNGKLPVIHVICDNRKIFHEFVIATKYPHLRFHSSYFSPINITIRKIMRRVTCIPFNTEKRNDYGLRNAVFVYPIIGPVLLKNKNKALAWIPDLQEEHLPHFFSESDIKTRRDRYNSFIRDNIPIVFSSNDARQDFLSHYHAAKPNLTFILPFAVFHPEFSHIDYSYLLNKYNIKNQYLFCPNQFWAHKNHMTLFEAFLSARKRGFQMQLVCSGKLLDTRDPNYVNAVLQFIEQNNLQHDIILLGFIDRAEQLCLMEHSYAVVQPSLFEGWSTTVEDVKRLGKFIFLSDLPVHREQNPINVCYFNPSSPDDLTEKILSVYPTSHPYDYNIDIRRSASSFLNIIDNYKYVTKE